MEKFNSTVQSNTNYSKISDSILGAFEKSDPKFMEKLVKDKEFLRTVNNLTSRYSQKQIKSFMEDYNDSLMLYEHSDEETLAEEKFMIACAYALKDEQRIREKIHYIGDDIENER